MALGLTAQQIATITRALLNPAQRDAIIPELIKKYGAARTQQILALVLTPQGINAALNPNTVHPPATPAQQAAVAQHAAAAQATFEKVAPQIEGGGGALTAGVGGSMTKWLLLAGGAGALWWFLKRKQRVATRKRRR
jgi:hypothetical protein